VVMGATTGAPPPGIATIAEAVDLVYGTSTEELREQAVKDGMLTLRMDGMLKVKRGITTLEEVVKETAA